MAEGSLEAKGAVHLRGDSGVHVYPAAQVKLDTTEDDNESGGLVWSFFFPADALRSLGPSATLEIDMRATNGAPFSLAWLNRLHQQRNVVLTIEGENRAASPSPWKGGALPAPLPLTPKQQMQQQQQQLQLQRQQNHQHQMDYQDVGLVRPEQEVIIDPYKPHSEPGSVRPLSMMASQSLPEEPSRKVEHIEEGQQELHKIKSGNELPHHAAEPLKPQEHESDVAVECAEGESWDEETEECRPNKSEGTGLWLFFVVSVLGIGGIYLISRAIMKRQSGGAKSKQRHTEFGRFDMLNMEERHLSAFDDDV